MFLPEDTNSVSLSWKLLIRQVVKNLCYQTKVNNKDPSPAMKFKALKSSSSKASGTFPDPSENGRWYANSSGEGVNLLSFGSG